MLFWLSCISFIDCSSVQFYSTIVPQPLLASSRWTVTPGVRGTCCWWPCAGCVIPSYLQHRVLGHCIVHGRNLARTQPDDDGHGHSHTGPDRQWWKGLVHTIVPTTSTAPSRNRRDLSWNHLNTKCLHQRHKIYFSKYGLSERNDVLDCMKVFIS